MRESEIGESVKNSKYIPIRNRVLGFTFSKPSLRNTRSTWPDSTWLVHMELESLRLEFHVDKPRGIWPLDTQKPSLRGSILGL